jgi:ankyrin repeat protein
MRVAPLHSAVAGDHFSVVAKLVEAGANVNAAQAGGFTPLMGAAQNGNLEITQLLLEHKADVNARTDKSSKEFPDMTALAFARQANAPEVAALLEGAGATV